MKQSGSQHRSKSDLHWCILKMKQIAKGSHHHIACSACIGCKVTGKVKQIETKVVIDQARCLVCLARLWSALCPASDIAQGCGFIVCNTSLDWHNIKLRSLYSVEGADVDAGGVCDKYEKDKNTRSVRRHLSAVRLCFTSRQVTSTTTLSPTMVASNILSTSMLLITWLLLYTSV